MKRFTSSAVLWPTTAFAALLLLNAFLDPSFFALTFRDGQIYGSLVDIAFRSVPLLLTALGMTLVIATGGVDLSVGATAALAGAGASMMFTAAGSTAATAFCSALAFGVAIGICNGFFIVTLGLQPIIATLVSMVTARGIAQLLIGGQIVPLADAGYVWLGTGSLFGLPFAIWLAAFVTISIGLILRKTSAGLFIEAVGSNSLAARFIGLSGDKVRWLVYSLTGGLAALAGVVMSANIRAVDGNNLGLYLELDAILAVVIGGTRLVGGRFSIIGTILGALIIQTVTTTINTQGIRVELMLMVKAAVVICICLAQSGRLSLPWPRSRVQKATP